MSDSAAPAAAPAVAPAAPEARVFVGNLPFKTSEEGLLQNFAGLNPSKATVAQRGRRPLGFGFVAFGSDADAQRAVEELNGKELDGRPLRLQIARPRDPNAPPRPARQPRPARPPRAPRASAPAADGKPAADAKPAAPADAAAAAPRVPRAPRKAQEGEARPHRPRRPRNADKKPADVDAPKAAAPAAAAAAAPAAPADGSRRPRRYRRKPVNRPPVAKIDTEKALFVGNLPFSVTDQTLLDIFKQFEAVSGRIATRVTGRSKGFGFVEFPDPTSRDSAFDKLQEVVVSGRVLTIKKAVPRPPQKTDSAPAAEAAAQ